tara:strand:+ start:1779 stop:2321 length:543 start_codon:yes stop_codon:yes gene_type:complete
MEEGDIVFKLYVDPQYSHIVEYYKTRIEDHNANYMSAYPDAGFDLLMPTDLKVTKSYQNKIGLGVRIGCWKQKKGSLVPHGYYLYPRSSISKTPLRLSNSVGIIDSGYRGELIAMVDLIDTLAEEDDGSCNFIPYTMNKLDRYFQICSPTLEPFRIKMVYEQTDLGDTQRGNRGFGSTGR